MLTLPKVVERVAQPYVAIRQRVTLPFDDAIGAIVGQLFDAMNDQKVEAAGPLIFQHNFVAMPDLEIDFAIPVAGEAAVTAPLVSGVLPAGRYAEITYRGPHDDLMEVNAVLIGWAKHSGIAWDSHQGPDGERFAARMEIYPNGPDDEPDPQKWETTVAIKIRD